MNIMDEQEKVTITITITGKVTGKTTVMYVPNSRQPTYEASYDWEDDLVPLESYRLPPKLTSVSFTFYPESESGERLYSIQFCPKG